MAKIHYKKSRKNFGSDIPSDKLQFYIPDPKTAKKCFQQNVDPRSKFLPPPIDGIRAHVGAGQNIRPGYDNIDAYPNIHRADYVQTTVEKFARAETLDTLYQPDSLAEIRLHHVFEHISILDLDRTLRTWNKLLKMGGTVFLEVPDFDACIRRILALNDDPRTEIFYRHIFGSQFTAGEYHRNGLTPLRLIRLLEQYGFEVTLAYTQWTYRSPNPLHMNYPHNEPLPDLTVAARKVGEPSPRASQMWTHESYRLQYPNPEISSLKVPGDALSDEVSRCARKRVDGIAALLGEACENIPADAEMIVFSPGMADIPQVAGRRVERIDISGSRADLTSLAAQKGAASVDAILAVGVIERSIDPLGVVKAMASLLRPGGWLCLTPAGPRPDQVSDENLHNPSPHWFLAACEAAGLTVKRHEVIGRSFEYLLEQMTGAASRLDGLGADMRDHPLVRYLREAGHYPVANWLAHGDGLFAAASTPMFCGILAQKPVTGAES
ncbi:MAG: hypothetical protein ACP5O1_02335 [Phycisphaerae bacterium]